MSEFPKESLGSLADLLDCLHKTPNYKEQGVPIVRVTDVKKGFLNLEGTLKISEEDFRLFSKGYIPQNEDIVFTRVGSYGISALVKDTEKFCLGQNTVLIKPKYINGSFLFYWLCTPECNSEIESLVGGSTQPTISMSSIRKIEVPLPTLPEQQAIAEVLSSLDDKIDLLHRNNKTLEEMAEALFRQWFVESSDINIVEEKALSSICKVLIGRTPPRNEHIWFTIPPNGINWMSIKDLGNAGTYITSTREALTQEAINRYNIPVIPKNTVVLSFKLTVGRVSITGSEMLSNEAIAQFQIEEDSTINYIYLYSFLKSYNYQSMGSTSSIAEAVNSRMIKEILCPIPTQQSLLEYTDLVNPIFSKILNSSKQIQELSNLRDSLLPKLMSGQVVVR